MNRRLSFFILLINLLYASCRDKPLAEQKVVFRKEVSQKSDVTTLANQTDSIYIAAVGDIMLGTSYPDNKTLPPDGAKDSFNNISDELHSADIAFGNLEGTLLDTGAPANYRLHQLSKPYLFRMPVSYGGVLKAAGFNVLSLANNHIGDFGAKGRASTMKVLDSLEINYGGQVSHPSAVFKVKGITVGFCAFAPNGETLSILDLKSASRIIQNLKQQCDIVMVSFHGGGEGIAYEHVLPGNELFINEKRGDVRAFARNAIDAGADVIFGNGPHVCRAMELYKNRLIAYSLGNFCTYKCVSVSGICGLAPLLKVYLNKKGEFLSGQITANKQTHDGGLEHDSLNGAVKKIIALTEADFPDSGLDIDDNGRITRNYW